MSNWTREQLEEGRRWRQEKALEWKRLHPKPIKEHLREFLGWFPMTVLIIAGPPVLIVLVVKLVG
jgi:hypothetical protein